MWRPMKLGEMALRSNSNSSTSSHSNSSNSNRSCTSQQEQSESSICVSRARHPSWIYSTGNQISRPIVELNCQIPSEGSSDSQE